MKHSFSNFKEWKAAALAYGLVLDRTTLSHEGETCDPCFCGKAIPRKVEHPEEEAFQQYGMFSTDWDEGGKAAVCSGFFFDTVEEWEKEIMEDHEKWTQDQGLVNLPNTTK